MNDTTRIPLFPLGTALFPEGSLPLRIFEPRYRRMIAQCLKGHGTFGVCLIAAGQEVGAPAVPYLLGTEAQIVSADHLRNGVVEIVVRGRRRFRVIDHEVEQDGLMTGLVRWLDEPPAQPVPPHLAEVAPLLERLIGKYGGGHVAEPHRYDDAGWVGARYAEWLPLKPEAKQRLLEMDDALERLEFVHQALYELGLLPEDPDAPLNR
ncbi:LON peptidase substrate-binding domain-containing protein [Thauera sinica]|uniref:LON peptidase substrate-binding domain-containing protein n=1 Tax=Thauera sinica TaxID=2665146 RepID=A0ABW1APK5_9RHOO|nr:LON peptidase substrate-binding domain-containing protein [Thauera sp. K11]ATE61602.1 peptidase S16 [Thauera sp. K11]